MAAECIPRPRPTHAFLPHASTSTPKTQMQNRAQPRSPFPDAALTPGSEWLARLAFLHSAFPSHLSDSCPHPRSQHPSPSPDRLGEVLVADPRDWDPRAAQGGLERAVLEHAQPVHVDLHRGVAALQVPAAGRLPRRRTRAVRLHTWNSTLHSWDSTGGSPHLSNLIRSYHEVSESDATSVLLQFAAAHAKRDMCHARQLLAVGTGQDSKLSLIHI
eukprot:444856-Rhodomonas_salina.2